MRIINQNNILKTKLSKLNIEKSSETSKSMKVGDAFKAEVIKIQTDAILLKLSDGSNLNANVSKAERFVEGEVVEFKVTAENKNSMMNIEVLSNNINKLAAETDNLFEKLNLKKDSENIKAYEVMKKLNIEPTKENIVKLASNNKYLNKISDVLIKFSNNYDEKLNSNKIVSSEKTSISTEKTSISSEKTFENENIKINNELKFSDKNNITDKIYPEKILDEFSKNIGFKNSEEFKEISLKNIVLKLLDLPTEEKTVDLKNISDEIKKIIKNVLSINSKSENNKSVDSKNNKSINSKSENNKSVDYKNNKSINSKNENNKSFDSKNNKSINSKNENNKSVGYKNNKAVDSKNNKSINSKSENNIIKETIKYDSTEKLGLLMKFNKEFNVKNLSIIDKLVFDEENISSQIKNLSVKLDGNEMLKNLLMGFKIENFKETQSIKDYFNNILNELSNVDKIFISKEVKNDIKVLSESISFLENENNDISWIQIPLNLNENQNKLDLFIKNESKQNNKITKNNAKILIVLDTDYIEKIQILIDIDHKVVNLEFKVFDDKIKNLIRKSEYILKDYLKVEEFEIININVRTGDNISLFDFASEGVNSGGINIKV